VVAAQALTTTEGGLGDLTVALIRSRTWM